MPVPRIFVSSTCWDLHEIRNNLRAFIEKFGYEPVMSEYGDIFYDYDNHVQDSCIEEINKCQMYILIIGNKYGSSYYKQKHLELPDSITLEEFKKSIQVEIPKHIFIHKLVNYDYRNYRKHLDKEIEKYFSSNTFEGFINIRKEREKVRQDFDSSFPFNQIEHKHIFRFLDEIYGLKVNNGVFEFESFVDIEKQLKKQWAGYLYESLSRKSKMQKEKEASEAFVQINNKLDEIEGVLNSFTIYNTDNEESIAKIDVKKAKDAKEEIDLEQKIHILDASLNDMLFGKVERKTNEKLTDDLIIAWLDTLEKNIQKYTWVGHVLCEDVISALSDIYGCYRNIGINPDSMEYLLQLYNGVKGNKEELESFIFAIKTKFTELDSYNNSLVGKYYKASVTYNNDFS